MSQAPDEVPAVPGLSRAQRLAALAEAHYQHSLEIERSTLRGSTGDGPVSGGDEGVVAWEPPIPGDAAVDEAFLVQAQRLLRP